MTATLQIRTFRWDDVEALTNLFNQVNGVSGTVKEFDTELMCQTLDQPSCQPESNCYVADSDGSVVGFVLVSPELPIERVVASGGVLKSHTRRGIGKTLVARAIEHSRELDARVLHIQASRNSAVERHILESLGFSQAKEYWQMQWEAGELPLASLPPGFELRSFRLDRDESALTKIQNETFSDNWGFCPNTVDEIAARVRLKTNVPEGILFITDNGAPAAYNWTHRNENSHGMLGFIGMTGVHPKYRGEGLGTAVVVAGLEYLRSEGIATVELEVDSQNPPARALYLKLGFQRTNRAVWYEKILR
ncbi:GNAT family N-acetyltransferase [Dehalococcoidia bacterium]|nr:GNAT family N-acetyltransferase [Dehalococcoidia bacterium]